jgi:hypothetical protein
MVVATGVDRLATSASCVIAPYTVAPAPPGLSCVQQVRADAGVLWLREISG